jgi:quinolinate synthase
VALSARKAAQSQRILELSEAFEAEILAHYYMRKEVRDLAHMVGGTRSILKRVMDTKAKALVICAVGFISDTARALRPDVSILVPRNDALCPFSEMADLRLLKTLREREPDSHISAGLKASADVKPYCDSIVALDYYPGLQGSPDKALPADFAPPAAGPPNDIKKEIITLPSLKGADGRVKKPLRDLAPSCQVHAQVASEEISTLKRLHPGAIVLANSLCSESLLELADFSGDSDALLEYARRSSCLEFIVVSETGLLEILMELCPDKIFHEPLTEMFCPNMKLTNIKDILAVLEAYSGLGIPGGNGLQPGAGEGNAHDLFR